MVIKYQISPSIITEDFVVKIWEAQSDNTGAEVYELTVPAPHSSPYTVTANGMDLVAHVVRLYTKDSAMLLHEYNVEPKENLVSVFDPIRFKIGDGGDHTPTENTATYTNEILAGLEDDGYLVFRNNYGFLHPNLHYTNNPGTGGFTLATPDVFNGDPYGEEFTILMQPQSVETVVNDSVVGKWFGGFVDVAADMSFEASHLRKLLRFSGTCTYSFDVNPPIGYAFVFQHFGASGTGTVAFNAPLLWNGTPKSSLAIPLFTEAAFVFDGTNWNVIYISESSGFNTTTPTISAGQNIAAGVFHIGDIPPGDAFWTVTHNKNISGDYMVLLTYKSPASSWANNNGISAPTFFHHSTDKPNKFQFTIQQPGNEVQNIDIAWLIVKL